MRCKGKTKSGAVCKMPALKGTHFCFTHNPDTRTAQAIARKIGGHNSATPHAGNTESINKQPRSIAEVMTILDYVLEETLALDNGIQRGRLLVSIAAQYTDALKVGELEAQLKELLRVLELRKE